MLENLRYDKNFHPSIRTRKLMLYVRKPKLEVGNNTRPGLFAFYGSMQDSLLFAIMLMCEFVGLFVLLNSMRIDAYKSLIIISTCIIIDLVVALIHHYFKYGISEKLKIKNFILKNQASENSDSKSFIAKNDKTIFWREFVSKISVALLFLFAALKFSNFYIYNINSDLINKILMLAVYLISVFIHKNQTGYCLFGWSAGLSYKIDVYIFNKNTTEQKQINKPPENSEVLEDNNESIIQQIENHQICKENNQIKLKTNGLLTDAEIQEMLRKCPTHSSKLNMLISATKIQLSILEAPDYFTNKTSANINS